MSIFSCMQSMISDSTQEVVGRTTHRYCHLNLMNHAPTDARWRDDLQIASFLGLLPSNGVIFDMLDSVRCELYPIPRQ